MNCCCTRTQSITRLLQKLYHQPKPSFHIGRFAGMHGHHVLEIIHGSTERFDLGSEQAVIRIALAIDDVLENGGRTVNDHIKVWDNVNGVLSR